MYVYIYLSIYLSIYRSMYLSIDIYICKKKYIYTYTYIYTYIWWVEHCTQDSDQVLCSALGMDMAFPFELLRHLPRHRLRLPRPQSQFVTGKPQILGKSGRFPVRIIDGHERGAPPRAAALAPAPPPPPDWPSLHALYWLFYGHPIFLSVI